MKDEFKLIPDCHPYMVNKSGVVKLHGKIIKPFPNRRGYLRLIMPKSNGKKFINVHRAVATTYIPNPNNYEQINHIDGNKKNNHVSNLEWCDSRTNVRHAFTCKLRNDCYNIKIYDLVENKYNDFLSIKDACRFLNIGGDTFITYVYRSQKYPIYDRYKIIFSQEEFDKVLNIYNRYNYNTKPIYVYDHHTDLTKFYKSVSHASIHTGMNTYTIRSKLGSRYNLETYYVGGYTFSYKPVFTHKYVPISKALEEREEILSKPIVKLDATYELYNYETGEVIKINSSKELNKFLHITSQELSMYLRVARGKNRTGLIRGYGIRLNNLLDWYPYTKGNLICSKLNKKIDYRVYKVTKNNKSEYVIGDKVLCEKYNINLFRLSYYIKNKKNLSKLVDSNIKLEYIP